MGENYNVPPVYNVGGGYQRKVTFEEAIERGFNNYANFSGRASRSEYWFWALFTGLLSFAAGMIDLILGIDIVAGYGPVTILLTLVLIVPSLAITWRRLHDIGRAGGWYFICLIPIAGGIILLIWTIKPSEMNDNRFGPVPNMVA